MIDLRSLVELVGRSARLGAPGVCAVCHCAGAAGEAVSVGVNDVSIEPGCLYVVATPIGNLGDMTARSLACLREVDLVAAEDTRRSRALLAHFGIQKSLISLHDHNERAQLQKIIAVLLRGDSVALVSDAGTPLISDPGYSLVRESAEHGLLVVPIPGPCSVIAALSAAGLPTDRFVYEGFLPARAAPRRRALSAVVTEVRTLVYLESAKRVRQALADMTAVFGGARRVVLARELTKVHEEFLRGTVAELAKLLEQNPGRCRGEFVVMVQGAESAVTGEREARQLLESLLQELPASRAAAVAARFTGRARKELYRLALELGGESH